MNSQSVENKKRTNRRNKFTEIKNKCTEILRFAQDRANRKLRSAKVQSSAQYQSEEGMKRVFTKNPVFLAVSADNSFTNNSISRLSLYMT